MISNGTDPQQYFSYADSLKIHAESFVWSNADVKAPAFNFGLKKFFSADAADLFLAEIFARRVMSTRLS